MNTDIRELRNVGSFYDGFNEPMGYGAFDQDQNQEVEEKFDLSKIDNIEFDDVDMKDYPDFVDAWVCSADYDGVPMTDDQLYDLNENYRDFVYEKLIVSIF